MCFSNYVEISRQALRANAAAVCEAARVPVIGVIKCDGYGVSVLEAAAAWQAAGVTMFAVSRPEEALTLRRLGFREQILLLCPVAELQTLKDMQDNGIIITVTSFQNALFYSTHGENAVRVHIAVDTGMGRFGIRWDDPAQVEAVYSLPGLCPEGIFSHFSHAFEKAYRDTKDQLQRFLQLIRQLESRGCRVGMRHIANSCAALRFPETRLDAVRVGSALVGRLPVTTQVPLEPVGCFKARVVDCRCLREGDTAGYGGYFKAKKATMVAVVALGRRDGFGTLGIPEHLRLRDLAAYMRRAWRIWRKGPCVDCRGQKLPVLGRVGQEYTLFRMDGLDVKPGDWVRWEGDLLLNSSQRRFLP